MIAFVLSGAGNRGPLEVGALRALLEKGIQPDLIVGTSAGAINASYTAARGFITEALDEMADLWRNVTTDTIYPENLLQIAWRLRTRADSLFSSKGMRSLLETTLAPHARTFGDCKIPLFVTGTDLVTSRLFVFGKDKGAPLVDAVLASASVPAIHPPVLYDKLQLVDGGVVANVAAHIAMDEGARTIYVINASYGGQAQNPAKGLLEVVGRSLNTMLAQALLDDIARATAEADVDLFHIHVQAFDGISFRDFSKTDEMLEKGYDIAKRYLDAGPAPFAPLPAAAPAPGAPSHYGENVAGAVEYKLPGR